MSRGLSPASRDSLWRGKEYLLGWSFRLCTTPYHIALMCCSRSLMLFTRMESRQQPFADCTVFVERAAVTLVFLSPIRYCTSSWLRLEVSWHIGVCDSESLQLRDRQVAVEQHHLLNEGQAVDHALVTDGDALHSASWAVGDECTLSTSLPLYEIVIVGSGWCSFVFFWTVLNEGSADAQEASHHCFSNPGWSATTYASTSFFTTGSVIRGLCSQIRDGGRDQS